MDEETRQDVEEEGRCARASFVVPAEASGLLLRLEYGADRMVGGEPAGLGAPELRLTAPDATVRTVSADVAEASALVISVAGPMAGTWAVEVWGGPVSAGRAWDTSTLVEGASVVVPEGLSYQPTC